MQNKSLNIGFIGNIPEPVGGAEIFLDKLIIHLGVYPIKIVLVRWLKQTICLGKRSKFDYEYRKKETIEFDKKRKIKIYYLFHRSKRSEIRTFLKMIYHSLKTAFFFYKEKINIIHCHLLTPNIYYGFIASKILRVPFVVTIHGLIDLIQPGYIFSSPRLKEREKKLLIWLLKRCERVIVVSDEIMQYCIERGLSNVEKKSAGIDTEFFFPKNTKEKGILFIGNLNQRKGFDLLLKSYLKIKDEINEPLYLVGKNSDGFDNRYKNVFYLGILTPDKLVPLIQRSKLVVLPSRTEGLPLAILEAMACNKLVLVSQVGELPILINEGENGFLLEELSVNKLQKQILKIAKEYPSLKTLVGQNPRKSILKYDIKKIADWHWSLYLKLMNSNHY